MAKLLFIFGTLVPIVFSAKLDQTYLPPASAHSAGGNGHFLNAPFTPVQRNSFPQPSNYQQAAYNSSPRNYGNVANNYDNVANNYDNVANNYDSVAKNYEKVANNYNNVAILRYNSDNAGDGSYHFEYETENKIAQHENGQLKNVGTDQEASIVTGSYSYSAPDGQVYTVDYVADENGFRASGNHLPTPPPVPEPILKSLVSNQANNGARKHQDYNFRSSNNAGYQY